METYITRQPIMNRDKKVAAYELLYQQDSSVLYNQRDSHVAKAVADYFEDWDNFNFLEGKDAFLTFTPNLLRQDIPHIFNKDRLVLQIEENVLIHPETRGVLEAYKKRGYRLALIGFAFNGRYFDILPQADYMKLDFQSEGELQNSIRLCKKFGIRVVAYNVNSPELLERALSMGADYFQGASVADMVRTKAHHVEHLQSNFYRLMGEITREQPDMDEIARIISIDVTLTVSLLRMVNSAYFGLRHKVGDIRQALVVLGLEPLRQWIYLLSFQSDGGMQDEIVKTSFQRAVLCQKLLNTSETLRGLTASNAYLIGMFSTLDVLLEVPMEQALAQLPLTDELNAALLRREGPYGGLLQLSIDYERGDWRAAERRAADLGVPMDALAKAYIEAVENAAETWDALQHTAQVDS